MLAFTKRAVPLLFLLVWLIVAGVLSAVNSYNQSRRTSKLGAELDHGERVLDGASQFFNVLVLPTTLLTMGYYYYETLQPAAVAENI